MKRTLAALAAAALLPLRLVGVAHADDALAAPDAPANLKAGVLCTDVGCRGGVTWTAPDDHGSPITSYTVADSSGQTTTVDGTTMHVDVYARPTDKTYTFSVVATNAIGTSTPASVTVDVQYAVPPLPYLDHTRPTIKRATLNGRVLKVRATDDRSGLARLQFGPKRSRHAKTVKIAKSPIVRTVPAKTRFVRVQDRSGNWSRWEAVQKHDN